LSENPLSPAFAELLTSVLLVLEGIRRNPDAGGAEYDQALEALEDLADRQAQHVPPEIADEVAERIEDARGALEAHDVEPAREALIGVGRAFDAWVRRRR
jgi:hypothetical protein